MAVAIDGNFGAYPGIGNREGFDSDAHVGTATDPDRHLSGSGLRQSDGRHVDAQTSGARCQSEAEVLVMTMLAIDLVRICHIEGAGSGETAPDTGRVGKGAIVVPDPGRGVHELVTGTHGPQRERSVVSQHDAHAAERMPLGAKGRCAPLPSRRKRRHRTDDYAAFGSFPWHLVAGDYRH